MAQSPEVQQNNPENPKGGSIEEQAIRSLMALTGDASRFRNTQRGFIDWKFSELCAYKGYQEARIYAESIQRWVNYKELFQGQCALDITFKAFEEARKSFTH